MSSLNSKKWTNVSGQELYHSRCGAHFLMVSSRLLKSKLILENMKYLKHIFSKLYPLLPGLKNRLRIVRATSWRFILPVSWRASRSISINCSLYIESKCPVVQSLDNSFSNIWETLRGAHFGIPPTCRESFEDEKTILSCGHQWRMNDERSKSIGWF